MPAHQGNSPVIVPAVARMRTRPHMARELRRANDRTTITVASAAPPGLRKNHAKASIGRHPATRISG